MAIQHKWQMAVQLKDKGGSVTTRTYDMIGDDVAGDMSALEINMDLVLADIDGITDCTRPKWELKKVFYDDAFALPTLDTAETNNQALFSVPIAGKPLKSGTLTIPGPKNAVFVNPNAGPGHDDVDVTAAINIAFINDFYPVGDGGKLYLSDGENANTDSFSGKRIHSKSTKG